MARRVYYQIQLEKIHVTAVGAQQFLSGQPVTSADDRRKLAAAMTGALDLIARDRGPVAMGLLLPAIQKVR